MKGVNRSFRRDDVSGCGLTLSCRLATPLKVGELALSSYGSTIRNFLVGPHEGILFIFFNEKAVEK